MLALNGFGKDKIKMPLDALFNHEVGYIISTLNKDEFYFLSIETMAAQESGDIDRYKELVNKIELENIWRFERPYNTFWGCYDTEEADNSYEYTWY